MNALLDQSEEKRIEITPLEPSEPKGDNSKRKPGRPRKDPKPKVETHAMTPARKQALEKARVTKRHNQAERKAKKEQEMKDFQIYQQSLSAPSQLHQGYHADPSFDHNASLAQSSPYQQPLQGQPQPYNGVNANGVYSEWSGQTDRVNRIEQLLDKLLSTQINPNVVPQVESTQAQPETIQSLSKHRPHVYNANPWSRKR